MIEEIPMVDACGEAVKREEIKLDATAMEEE